MTRQVGPFGTGRLDSATKIMTAMSYGHAERNLAAIRLLERQADELLDRLRVDDPRAWRRALDADELSTVQTREPLLAQGM